MDSLESKFQGLVIYAKTFSVTQGCLKQWAFEYTQGCVSDLFGICSFSFFKSKVSSVGWYTNVLWDRSLLVIYILLKKILIF